MPGTGDKRRKQISWCVVTCISAAFIIVLVLQPVTTRGASIITDLSPTGFFTNVASRLLSSELSQYNLSLTNIPVYPTNEYTPAVHRLLQVTANLYDSITNRALGLSPEYPYCPSVFRPIFRRINTGTNSIIVIAGYREVIDTSMANPSLAPAMIELDQPNPPLSVFPSYGTPFSSIEKNEPMVSGVPLIIGAKKGFPNFNELAMQTEIYVSRLLEFRRASGDINGPVVQTNQMYVMGITNTFGLEAWNSYLTNYPRDLQLIASVNMTAIVTNDTATNNVVLSNRVTQGRESVIPAGAWQGWTSAASVPNSMVLPFGTTNTFAFLSNSTALSQPPWFEPQTHIFPVSTLGAFYVPHWSLNLNTRLIFILVDTQANRIVDYVNLSHWEPTVDIISELQRGNTANPTDYKNPVNQ